MSNGIGLTKLARKHGLTIEQVKKYSPWSKSTLESWVSKADRKDEEKINCVLRGIATKVEEDNNVCVDALDVIEFFAADIVEQYRNKLCVGCVGLKGLFFCDEVKCKLEISGGAVRTTGRTIE